MEDGEGIAFLLDCATFCFTASSPVELDDPDDDESDSPPNIDEIVAISFFDSLSDFGILTTGLDSGGGGAGEEFCASCCCIDLNDDAP